MSIPDNVDDVDHVHAQSETQPPQTPVYAHVMEDEAAPDAPAEHNAYESPAIESLPAPDGEVGTDATDSSAGVDAGPTTGQEAEKKNRYAFREIVETVLITLAVFLLVRLVIQNFRVDGDSMLPTLHSDQYLLVNKGLYFRYDANLISRIFNPGLPSDMHYLFHGPQRGDIVVFLSPTEPQDFIKRVIAVEGETVQIKPDPGPGISCPDCGVFVNGTKLDEPYIKDPPNYTVDPIVVPPGDIYVLGDNRRNSSDSHVWGPLPVDNIVGIAFLSYWPTNEWGFLPHPSYAQPAGK